jgi:hypothetical protein
MCDLTDRALNAACDMPKCFLAMRFQFHGTTRGLGPAYLTDEAAAPRPLPATIPFVRALPERRTFYLHPVEASPDPSPLSRW